MKGLYLTCFLLTFQILNINSQDIIVKSKSECSVRNFAFKNIDETNILNSYLVDEDRSGLIELHPFNLEEIGG